MLRELGPLVGWAILPNYASKIVLEVYYGFFYKFGTRPRPGTQVAITHYRRVHATLVVAYLLLTIYDAYHQIQTTGDFYQILGISHDATERAIKSRFRRLAAQFHPDKQTSAESSTADNRFLALRIAQETLSNPIKRFAYDRFGPAMLQWEHCASIKEYVHAGFRFHAPSYVGAGMMTLALSAMGYLDWGKYWRYLGGASVIILEAYTITRPDFPNFLASVVNPILSFIPYQSPLLPFQMLALSRQIALAVSIAISQLGGSSRNERSGHNEIDEQRLARLEFLSMMTEVDTSRLLKLELAPFVGDQKALQKLKSGMADWLHQNTIRADAQVRQAITQAMEPGGTVTHSEAKHSEGGNQRTANREPRDATKLGSEG